MTKQLYEEALADVKKLKEVAEDNAKKALIEAVAPRIKDLIENELLKKPEDDLLLDDEFQASDPAMSMASTAVDAMGGDSDISSAISLPDEEGRVTLDLDALAVEPSETSDEFKLSAESKKTIGNLVEKINSAATIKLESKLYQLTEKLNSLSKAGNLIRKMSGFKSVIEETKTEVESLYEGVVNSSLDSFEKKNYSEKLENLYSNLNKLMEQGNMRNRNRNMINEADVALKLTGLPDDINLDDIGVDLVMGEEGEEPEAEEGEEEAEEGGELDLGGEEGEEEAEEAEEAEEGGEGEEEAEEGGELDLGDEGEEGGKTQQESHMLRNSNLVVEIDENMLRREISKMKNLRESRDSDDVIVEIDENMLRREISRMRTLREEKEGLLGKDANKWGHGPGSVSDEFEDDDLGDPFVDVKLRENDMGSKDEMYEADEEEAKDEMYEADEEEAKDEMYEADEEDEAVDEGEDEGASEGMHQARDKAQHGGSDRSDSSKRGRSPGMDEADSQKLESLRRRITRERRLQLELKQKAQAAKTQGKQKQKKAQQNEQQAQTAKKQGQNKTAMQKKGQANQMKKEAKKLSEAYAHFATQFNESVLRTRRLMGMLNEAKSRSEARPNGASNRLSEGAENLRKKLAETNLFNTKLLYSNKLLQNESLTRRQKAEVIERLDEAKSEREAKLVYESMVKTLEASSRQLKEVAERRVLGSSSQATRPASTPMNEGVELDRWAKLAGIK